MEEEGKALVIILTALARRGADTARKSLGLVPGEYGPGDPSAGKLRKVVDQYPRLDVRDIGDFLKQPVIQSFPEGAFVELETSNHTKDGFAFLWCKWKLDTGSNGQFFYGLFRLGDRHEVDNEVQPGGKVPQFWGYRFETPDLRGPEHRFLHAQPTISMSPNRVKIGCALPVPATIPTFPLACTSVCGLLLTMVLAVLGRVKLDSLINELQLDPRLRNNAYFNEGVTQATALVQPG